MKPMLAGPSVWVRETPPELSDRSGEGRTRFTLRRTDFREPLTSAERRKADEPYLIVGFDTEFQSPDEPVTRDDLKAGMGKYRVLSYQFHCKASEGKSWSGIAVPEGDERMSLGEFLVFALAAGVRLGHVERLPTTVYLAGHFTRADVPAFSDFKTLQSLVASVRKTFASIDGYVPVDVTFKEPVRLKVHLRDTMLLTPAGSKSRITNPYFAAFITSAVRAVLGEIMNALPDGTTVFSCTTDGFLTDASAADVEGASAGPLAETFRRAREALTGERTLTEVKHVIGQPLGWRTRGQATLRPGQVVPGSETPTTLLARSGIHLRDVEEVDEQNERIVEMFFGRTPQDRIETNYLTSVRDMVRYEADLVEKCGESRLNMEYDWKRRAVGVHTDPEHGHVAFDTVPWQRVEDFQRTRELFTDFQKRTPRCIKSEADYEAFRSFAETVRSLPDGRAKYLRRSDDADLVRLRQMLCAAWRQSLAGLDYRGPSGNGARTNAQSFADILAKCGVPCARYNVEDGKRRAFVSNSCLPTRRCLEAVDWLLRDYFFPSLRTEDLFAERASASRCSGECGPTRRVASRVAGCSGNQAPPG